MSIKKILKVNFLRAVPVKIIAKEAKIIHPDNSMLPLNQLLRNFIPTLENVREAENHLHVQLMYSVVKCT